VPLPPTPTDPTPIPTPTDPTPIPTPTDPTPIPTPTDPTPIPTPTDPTPIPTPTDPTPIPTPTDPTPIPTPTDPTPIPTPTPTPTPQAPEAVDDLVQRRPGDAATFNVLANDSDPQDQPLRLVSFSTATNGVVTEADETIEGLLTYTPNAGFNGTDSFTYAVTGGDPSLVSQATVTVEVNQAPVIINNRLLVVSRNEIAEVSREFLVAQDEDNASNEIVFQVIGGPNTGRLLRLGSNPETIVPGRSFSQANIDSGSLRYEALELQEKMASCLPSQTG
jgi:hypothetical protein